MIVLGQLQTHIGSYLINILPCFMVAGNLLNQIVSTGPDNSKLTTETWCMGTQCAEHINDLSTQQPATGLMPVCNTRVTVRGHRKTGNFGKSRQL